MVRARYRFPPRPSTSSSEVPSLLHLSSRKAPAPCSARVVPSWLAGRRARGTLALPPSTGEQLLRVSWSLQGRLFSLELEQGGGM